MVEEWNPESRFATALIISSVSLKDEIKIDGYGMAIIDFLYLSGILYKKEEIQGITTWKLSNKWEHKTPYMYKDGL